MLHWNVLPTRNSAGCVSDSERLLISLEGWQGRYETVSETRQRTTSTFSVPLNDGSSSGSSEFSISIEDSTIMAKSEFNSPVEKVQSAMQSVEPEAVPGQPGHAANAIVAMLAVVAFVVGFFGRLIGLLLVGWEILPTPIDPLFPMEFTGAAPLALIALTSAVILRRRTGQSRLLTLARVLSVATLIWSLFLGIGFLLFDGGSV
jgi:hypothetical protein